MLSPEIYKARQVNDAGISDLSFDDLIDKVNDFIDIEDLKELYDRLNERIGNLFCSLTYLQEQNQAIDPEIAGRYYELTEVAKQCESRFGEFNI